MPKAVEIKHEGYKDSLPDKSMKLELISEEMEIFYDAFPGIKTINNTVMDGYEPAKIKVEITVEAFKKKTNGIEEKK